MNAFRKTVLAAASAAALFASTSAYANHYDYNVDFLVENYSGYAIVGVWATHIDSSSWGPNLLRGGWIDGWGGSAWFTPYNPQGYCRFDILLEYEDGLEETLWDVNLCEEYVIVADEYGTYVY